MRRESIERRRGRPVVPKKASKSRQSEEFKGELAMFKNYDKYDFFNHLSTSCLRITDKDAETILTYNWVHDLLYEKIFELCSEVQFARFCQVVSMANDIFNPIASHSSSDASFGYKEGKKPCVLLKNPAWIMEKVKGTLSVSGRNYCLPLVLLKLLSFNIPGNILLTVVLGGSGFGRIC